MKLKLVKQGLFITLILLLFSACHNWFNDDEEPVNDYLKSYEEIKPYTPIQIEWLFDNYFSGYPELADLKDKFSRGFTVYKITYNTTFKGEQNVASGLVCIPFGEGPFPILSYQNGTNTLHSNAPSENPYRDLYLMLEFVASTGFVVAIPDYIGFGSSDNIVPHPYLHKESTIQSVLDMLRAVKELTKMEGAELKNELYITGYSQGGWATMQIQKAIEAQFSSEFNLVASAPSAGPYDLEYINEYIKERTHYPMPFFLGYICASYLSIEEMTTPIDAIFNEPYADTILSLFDGTRSGDTINARLTTDVAELLTEDYLQNSEDTIFTSLHSALEENSVSAWETTTPTLIIHGTADELVPYQVSKNIYDDFMEEGVSGSLVQLIDLPDKGHKEGIIPAGLISISWFLELTE